MTSKWLSFFKPTAPAKPVASPQAQLEQARVLHQQGQREAALALYAEILETFPHCAEAYYRRANVLKDQGALESALADYERAVGLKPDYAYALCNRAVVLERMARLPEALASYDRAISINPADALAHCNRGMLLNGLGQKDAALASCEKAVACNADFYPAHFGRGVLLQERKEWAASLASYDRAIAINASDPLVHYNRGAVLMQLERWLEALTSYDRAIALNGAFALAHAGRAEVLQRLSRLPEALESYDRAIAIDPRDATTHNNRGVVLKEMRRFDAALASYEQAIAVRPGYADAYFNCGAVLAELRDFAGALVCYDRALSINPALVGAYLNRANALEACGSLIEAMASLRQAIALDPNLAEAHFNLALLSLKVGDLITGWALYEWRWRTQGGPVFLEKRQFRQPVWRGSEDLTGRTILLYGEQGLGDSLQFSRYAELVARLGARVILEVPRPLVSLCGTLRGVTQVVAYGDPLPPFDVQCALMTLPLVFRTTLETIPAAAAYVSSDPDKLGAWQQRLGTKKVPRVGLTWSGNRATGSSRERFFALAQLVPYLSNHIEYFCLQTDITAADQQTLARSGLIRQFDGELRDFSDTAALCECMDLVLTVDTSVAHVGGALGKRTWVLLAFSADWRWFTDRQDSPWYPSLRLFRQQSRDDWQGLFERVAAQLHRELILG